MNWSQEINSTGYIYLPSFDPHLSASDIMMEIGKPYFANTKKLAHILSPKSKEEETPNSYSGNYGLDFFPFHSDFAHWKNPPRYILLRCIQGYEEVATPILDTRSIISGKLKDQLKKTLARPRRPINGSVPLIRMLSRANEGDWIFRWDELFLLPKEKQDEKVFCEISEEIKNTEPNRITLSKPGDTLILDNWRFLHAREKVPEFAKDRIIERAYLGEIN